MANRLNAPNQFETLAPPWILSQLDTNFTQNQAAWNDSSLGFVNGVPTDTGTANAYVVSLPFGSPSSYNAGMTVVFIPANTNTGASSITVSPLGSASIVNSAGQALTGGEIAAHRLCGLVYDGTNFRILTPCGLFSSTSSATSVTINAAGYQSVCVQAIFTAGGLNLTINNVACGTVLTLSVVNNSGSTNSYALGMTDPAATSFSTIQAVVAGGIGGLTNIQSGSGSFSLSNNTARVLTGVAGVKFVTFT